MDKGLSSDEVPAAVVNQMWILQSQLIPRSRATCRFPNRRQFDVLCPIIISPAQISIVPGRQRSEDQNAKFLVQISLLTEDDDRLPDLMCLRLYQECPESFILWYISMGGSRCPRRAVRDQRWHGLDARRMHPLTVQASGLSPGTTWVAARSTVLAANQRLTGVRGSSHNAWCRRKLWFRATPRRHHISRKSEIHSRSCACARRNTWPMMKTDGFPGRHSFGEWVRKDRLRALP